jgi:acyl-coenzyme A thioesterase PaaI-like protein
MSERRRILIDLDPPSAVRARRRAAHQVRHLAQLVAMAELDEATLDAVAAEVEAVLRGLGDAVPLSRYVHDDPAGRRGLDQPLPSQESEIIFGPSSPLSTPLEAYKEPDGSISGVATFPYTYEGPPGSVHGGMLAACFDALLGMAAATSGHPSMTGTMTVAYRAPTPLNRPIRFEAWFEGSEGRKSYTKAAAYDADVLCAEAEGVFIEVARQHFAANAEG